MKRPLNVLIVDDDRTIARHIKEIVLEEEGRILDICHDGHSALSVIKSAKVDLIFMDIDLKGPLDGIGVIRAAGAHNAIVYFISGFNDENTIQEALGTNSYHYLIKPVRDEEIKIAMTVARRQLLFGKPAVKQLFLGKEITFNTDSEEVLQNGIPVALTGREHQMIALLAKHINTVLSLETIKGAIWFEEENIADSTLRNFIRALRQKLPGVAIQNSYGRGYILKSPVLD